VSTEYDRDFVDRTGKLRHPRTSKSEPADRVRGWAADHTTSVDRLLVRTSRMVKVAPEYDESSRAGVVASGRSSSRSRKSAVGPTSDGVGLFAIVNLGLGAGEPGSAVQPAARRATLRTAATQPA
jgi:hypothetical protein